MVRSSSSILTLRVLSNGYVVLLTDRADVIVTAIQLRQPPSSLHDLSLLQRSVQVNICALVHVHLQLQVEESAQTTQQKCSFRGIDTTFR